MAGEHVVAPGVPEPGHLQFLVNTAARRPDGAPVLPNGAYDIYGRAILVGSARPYKSNQVRIVLRNP